MEGSRRRRRDVRGEWFRQHRADDAKPNSSSTTNRKFVWSVAGTCDDSERCRTIQVSVAAFS